MAMNMGDMGQSSSSDSMGNMGGMSVVFTLDHSTPLYSSRWTPSTAGAYAGTCIFLIVLAVFSRGLLACRRVLEQKWHDKAVKRRYIVVADEGTREGERQLDPHAEKSDRATLTTRGIDESVRVIQTWQRKLESNPWRFSTDLPRACIFVVQAGVGYLLMLAVMTLNVGYFLSVLAGLFVGELALARYTLMDDGHH